MIHQENRGPASARNAGLEIVRGAYVHFLDSDDRLKPHALETLYSEAAGKDLDILFFCAEVFSDNPDLQEDVKVHRDEFLRADQAGIIMSGKESLRPLALRYSKERVGFRLRECLPGKSIYRTRVLQVL